ncbi:MAG: Rrf2 family transcriptional regulator [Desulfovibrio sp.]|nr:Rrf2 family transcriptional regulator [Desulfovibrio sp.]
MRLSVNTRYAVRMLCTLAQADRPVSLSSLAERIGTSKRAMENVHALLKRHGITEGSVGPRGGLVMKRALADISIGDLLILFGDAVDLSMCRTGRAASCPESRQCPSRVNWRAISARLQDVLNAATLKEIMNL